MIVHPSLDPNLTVAISMYSHIAAFKHAQLTPDFVSWFDTSGELNCAFRVLQKEVRGVPLSKIPRTQGEAPQTRARARKPPRRDPIKGGRWCIGASP